MGHGDSCLPDGSLTAQFSVLRFELSQVPNAGTWGTHFRTGSSSRTLEEAELLWAVTDQ